jgi:spore germination cell wall hydrolase CwlJ-like protein
MHDRSILDLALDPRHAPAPSRQARPKAMVLATIGLALAIGAVAAAPGLIAGLDRAFGKTEQPLRISLDQQRALAAMTVEDKSQILAEGLSAQQRNAEIPLSALPIEAVSSTKLGGADGPARATALRCLTQAVYYEAATEPLQGRRAVAQVVLNRMRHPAYPNSVCAVVYQGVERGWGCQFSFVCDGALLRAPSAVLWREAEGVAKAALAGFVEKSVGTATHYHADYVLPKWAFQLGKITQLGRHIFYRFNGGMGRSLAFTDRYSGVERIPAIDFAALQLKVGEDALLAGEPELVPGLTVTRSITDRHAPADVGGRLDTTKEWRLAIPDPVAASARYRQAIGATAGGPGEDIAAADPPQPAMPQ